MLEPPAEGSPPFAPPPVDDGVVPPAPFGDSVLPHAHATKASHPTHARAMSARRRRVSLDIASVIASHLGADAGSRAHASAALGADRRRLLGTLDEHRSQNVWTIFCRKRFRRDAHLTAALFHERQRRLTELKWVCTPTMCELGSVRVRQRRASTRTVVTRVDRPLIRLCVATTRRDGASHRHSAQRRCRTLSSDSARSPDARWFSKAATASSRRAAAHVRPAAVT
jgi:hypothetical protein